MKTVLSLFLALMLLQASPAARAEEAQGAAGALLSRLSELLDVREKRDTCLQNCYRQVDAFLRRGDYASLVRARLACSESREALEETEAPPVSLKEGELLELMRLNVETAGLEDMASGLKNRMKDDAERLLRLENFLYSSAVSLKDGLAAGRRLLDTMAGMLSLETAFDCLQVNDLLLPLAGDAGVSGFLEGFAARWPAAAESREEWISDPAALADRAAALLEGMEKQLDSISEAFGRNEYMVRRYTRDPEALEADFRPVAGMPARIPLPSFWLASSGRSLHAGSGDAGGETLPDRLVLRIPGVSPEQFLAYTARLSELGLEGEPAGDAREGWKAAFVMEGKPLLAVLQANGDFLMAWNPGNFSAELR